MTGRQRPQGNASGTRRRDDRAAERSSDNLSRKTTARPLSAKTSGDSAARATLAHQSATSRVATTLGDSVTRTTQTRTTRAAATTPPPADPGAPGASGTYTTARRPSATRAPSAEQSTLRLDIGASGPADQSSGTSGTVPSDRALMLAKGASRELAAADGAMGSAVLIRGASKPPTLTGRIVPRRHGPRSAFAQFAGAMVVAIAFVSAISLASPLGQVSGASNAFSVYANALPWVPTPTPTPTPPPVVQQSAYGPPQMASPGQQAIVNEIIAVFGPYAQGALNVARCESGYDPNAWNSYPIMGSHASGVFQILYPGTWDGTSYAGYSPYDANANIHAAYQLFQRDGYTWREWACQP